MRIFLVLISLLMTSCGLLPRGPSADDADAANRVANDFTRSRLIADDFVAAMVQLPQLEPAATTLSTRVPGSRFGQLLLHGMQSVGYEFRVQTSKATTDAEAQSLAYFVSRRTDSTSEATSLLGVYDFLIEAGGVKLKRSYKVDRDGVWPASSMYVLGADAAGLQLDTRLFDGQRKTRELPKGALIASAPADSLPITQTNNSNLREVSSPAVPYTSPTRRLSATPIANSRGSKGSATAQVSVSITKLPVKRNMYELKESNYAEILANYRTVERKVLVFDNDSMVMGPSNKRIAETIANNFNRDTDLISVVGCSHGSTALNNGNALLANGRASRVKEEFLLAGVESELVLDEGCWAGTSFDKMPPRGVVVTHKRRS